MSHARCAWVVSFVCLAWGCTAAAPRPARDAAAATLDSVEPSLELEQSVERSLLPPVVVQGEAAKVSTLAARMSALKVTGLSIAVFDESGIVWVHGYGLADAETKAPVTVKTLFQAGSISKSVNALAVLLAAANGSFELDAPINQLTTQWKLPDNDLTQQEPVTLRRLLSHTAGTTVHGFPGYPSGAPLPTLLEVLDGRLPANTPPVRVDQLPGAQFRYSGGGTTIVQLVLVDTFSKPYPVILQEQVLDLLGMASSTFEQPLPAERLERAAAGHDGDGLVIPTRRHVYPEMAAAGLWTTPSDLAMFFRELALARAGRSTKVSQRVAQEMTTVVDTSAHVGLGVFLQERNGVGFFGHGGVDEGFNANAIASLEGAHGLVMMANSAKGMQLFPEIERTVFAALGWAGADAPVVRVPLNAAERAAWLGDFEREGDVPFTIRLDDERLMMARPLTEPVELISVGPRRSVHPGNGLRFSLHDGAIDIEGPRGPLGRATRVAAGEKLPLLELAAGHEATAIDGWREQLNRDPSRIGFGVQLCLGYGHELLETSALASALTLFRACVQVLPAFPALHAGLGAAYAAQGQRPAAIEAYELALLKIEDASWLAAGQKQSLRESIQRRLEALRATSSR